MTVTAEKQLALKDNFLEGICIWSVEPDGKTCSLSSRLLDEAAAIELDIDCPVPEIVKKVCETGRPVAEKSTTGTNLGTNSSEKQCGFALPIFVDSRLTSILLLVGGTGKSSRGVIESWEPTGEYAEMNLESGCYVGLDRFENVSRFVRFDYGQGLPGLVWKQQRPIVHENLSSHPGFLRAAGASAAELETGIGFPLVGSEFVSSVLMISSEKSPMSKAVDHWSIKVEVTELSDTYGLDQEAEKPADVSPFVKEIAEKRQPALSSDLSHVAPGREQAFVEKGVSVALGIPIVGNDAFHILVIYM